MIGLLFGLEDGSNMSIYSSETRSYSPEDRTVYRLRVTGNCMQRERLNPIGKNSRVEKITQPGAWQFEHFIE
jgi:hypothetical protein